MAMPFPAAPTVTSNTAIDFLVGRFGSDLYSIVPGSADATDKSGNANDFTAVGSPTFGSTDLVVASKNTLSASMLGVFGAGSGGKYIRRQNTAGSGVVRSMGDKGLSVGVVFKPDGATTGYKTVFDFRRASGTAGRNGIVLQINNGAADGGESTKCVLRIVAAGGNSDWLEFDTGSGADGWWNDTDIKRIVVQYQKGDVAAGVPNRAGVWVEGVAMTPTSSSLSNILTSDTFSDSATAGDYLTFAGYYAGHYGAGGNYAHMSIVKRWMTAEDRYALLQAMSYTSPEGIPFSMNGGFDYAAEDAAGRATPPDDLLVTTIVDRSGFGSTAMTPASTPNDPFWRRDQNGRYAWSFDNQMQTQGGDGKYAACAVAPNGKLKRRGVLFAGSVLASRVLAQTWQRVLTYKGTSNRISFAVYDNLPVMDVNNTIVSPSSAMGWGAASATISAISTAELLTTSAAHKLIPGLRVSITGTNSTPVFNGEYVVATTPSTTTFTVAARDAGQSVPDVTIAGTAGTVIVPAGPIDRDLPTVPCVPQIGTMCWGTGRDGIVAAGLIGCGGRIAKGTTRTLAAGSYTNALDVAGVVGFDASLSDEDGASMPMHRIMDVGRTPLAEDYERFHWFTNAYLNPKDSTEYADAVALLTPFTYYQSLTGHVGIRDIGLTIGGTSLECGTPNTGTITENRGWQGRFSAAFARRLAYVHTFAIGGNLAGPDKNTDGTCQSGFGTNILTGTVDWTSPGITADAQRGPITHILWLEPWTNTMARGVDATNAKSVSSISTAELITTSTAHNLLVGQRVTVTGSNSTPSFDGEYVVATTPSTTTFTVTGAPDVTNAGTAAGSVYPDLAHYGPIQSALETIRRWKTNNPEGVVFIQLPSADMVGATRTSLAAQCAAWKADGTIANYIEPTAKGALHWTFDEQAAEADRNATMVVAAVGSASTGSRNWRDRP